MNKKVCVLTLNYNGKYLLDDCLNSYLENDYPNSEIVVIDNGSNDGSQEYIKKQYPNVTLIENNANLGYSTGFNVGLRYAFNERKADYALITNNDVKADKNVISELVKVAESEPNIGFVIGKVYYYDSPNVLQTVGKKSDEKYWRGDHIGNKEIDNNQYNEIAEREFCDDIFWLVKRNVFIDTGGYDTTFTFQGEDFDWQVRAKKAGYKIMYTPYAKIWHKESMTLGKTSSKKIYYDSRNPLIVHLKHRTAAQVKPYMQFLVKNHIKNSFRFLFYLKFRHFYALWKGFSSALTWGVKNKKLSIRHFI